MKYTIYRIVNSHNQKSYIGATKKTAEFRLREHVNKSNRDIPLCKFHLALREFGAAAFSVENLDVAKSLEESVEMEAKYISIFNSYHDGYNSNEIGGPAGADAAKHFGEFTEKGAANPKAGSYLMRLPDGREIVVKGMREFCRDHNIIAGKLYTRGRTKGYVLLGRLNDQRESA